MRFEQAREGGDVGGEVELLGGGGAGCGCLELKWGFCCYCYCFCSCTGLDVRAVVDRAMRVVRGLGRKREVHAVVLVDGSRAGSRAGV